MKKSIKIITIILTVMVLAMMFTGCDDNISGGKADISKTVNAANNLQTNQPTPTDVEYSLERYNLIKRAYWVNGMRDKANTFPCSVTKPVGYIVLFAGNAVVASYTVDGKVSSLNSYLTPDSEYYERSGGSYSSTNKWLADIDGSYGTNDNGIFFFTTDGKYVEWTGTYLYSDIPMKVTTPVVQFEVNGNE